MKDKKNAVIAITFLVIISLLLLGLTYAYYRTRIVGNTSEKSISVLTKKIEIVYQNESAMITANDIEPGWNTTKTFEVRNTGDEVVNYSIKFDNVSNAFMRSDWRYILSDSLGNVLSSDEIGFTTTYIVNNISIDPNETQSYELYIEYTNLKDINQSDDMGKEFSLRINIDDALASEFASYTDETLLASILNNNDISEVMTDPGKEASMHNYSGVLNTMAFDSNRYTHYWTYGTGYEYTGSVFHLTGVTTCYWTECDLEGKYIVSNDDFYASNASNVAKNTRNLSQVYQVVKVENKSLDYHTITSSNLNKPTEAILSLTEDNYGTSYYFRGAVENNFVNYSGMCFRIVRIQGNGTVKLVLADGNNECNSSAYNINNGTSSYVSKDLDEWIETVNSTQLVTDALWCNDVSVVKYYNYGEIIYYGASSRIKSKPSLKCNFYGAYSGYESYSKLVTAKVKYLTADEIAFAGASEKTSVTYNYYLINNARNGYVSFTPHSRDISGVCPSNAVNLKYVVGDEGSLITDPFINRNFECVIKNYSIRPAIVINGDALVTYDTNSTYEVGTYQNPYKVS